MTAAGVIEPVIAHDKVSVKLSLPQRSVHGGGWLFHHRLNAGAMEVLSRQCQPQEPSKCLSSAPLDIVTAASSAMSLWFTGQRQAQPSGALRGEPPIGAGLALKVGLETLIRLGLGHPLKRESVVDVLGQQIQGHAGLHKRQTPTFATSAPFR
jgi:hypothetical protein